ncbi:unnamed protein product, partial [Fusarium langsethiae]
RLIEIEIESINRIDQVDQSIDFQPWTTEYTTSTVYSTKTYTITECAPWVHDCGYIPYETTEIIPVYTTVCPVYYEPTPEPQWTTSTVCTTYYRTVTECEPYCPETPYITTEIVPIYTTVCPITEVAPAPTKPAEQHPHYQPYECKTEELTTSWSTSTVYKTEVKSLTGCAHGDTWCNYGDTWCDYDSWCDYGTPYVTTETIALSTTLCPEVITEWVPCPTYHPLLPPVVVTYTSTSTYYTTEYYTITACPYGVPYCAVGHKTSTVYATATTCYTFTYTTTVAETTYTRLVPPTFTVSTATITTATDYSSKTNTVYYSTTPTLATSTYTTQSTRTSTWMTQSMPTYPTSAEHRTSIEKPSSMEQPSSMQGQPTSVEHPASMQQQPTSVGQPASMQQEPKSVQQQASVNAPQSMQTAPAAMKSSGSDSPPSH